MTLYDCQVTAVTHLPRLASLVWARKQAKAQERDAAGAERKRWELVLIILDEQIKEQERKITRQMDVLKFKTKGEAS